MNLRPTSRLASLLLAVTVAAIAPVAHADDVSALLKAADKFRMSGENMQIDTLISVFNTDGTPDKERRYLVFAQAKHQSLVLMQSPAEKGQKVLMLGDDYWLLMPGSQRPLRITPMQKLLGDASTGDIATLSWAEDYTGSVVGEEPCGEPAQSCLHLSLQANRKGVTYQRIELWIGKARHEPVRADLYVQSDKLAKQARFVVDKPNAPTTVTEMLLSDQLTNRKETRVRYLGRKEHVVPQAWLNPMFLARNPTLE
ncbi:MAG: outer membrane lipoprotein-sorting protein [Caldimonas sp.]